MFLIEKLNVVQFWSRFHPSNTDIVETMNTLNRKRHNPSENCNTIKVSRRTQKVENNLANEHFGRASLSTDLGHIIREKVGIRLRVMLRGKGPRKAKIAYCNVRIHSLMIYTNLTLYHVVGDRVIPSLRCFTFTSGPKAAEIFTI